MHSQNIKVILTLQVTNFKRLSVSSRYMNLFSFFTTRLYLDPFILKKWPILWSPVVILSSSLCWKMPCVIQILHDSFSTSFCNGRLASAAFRKCNPLITFYIFKNISVFLPYTLSSSMKGVTWEGPLVLKPFVQHLEYLEHCYGGLPSPCWLICCF